MNITDYLLEKAEGLVTKSPEVLDNEKHGYEMIDTGAVEIEVGELLYGLVRLIKPHQILETGTYTGVSAMYMGAALKENKRGLLTTLEIDQSHIERAEKLWKLTQVDSQITALRLASLDFEPSNMYELMFLDSEPHLRFAELVKFYDHLSPGGFVLIHDLHNHLGQQEGHESPFGRLPTELSNWIIAGSLKPWYFPNPRGMVGFQKRKAGDKPDYA